MPTSRKSDRWTQLVLFYLGLINAFPGLWALSAPHSFYGSFPGLGHAWVAVYGPYNEHLVRDVGGFFVALSVLCFLTVFGRVPLSSTAICLLSFNLPHLVYHLIHLHRLLPIDQLGNVIALSVNVLLPGLLLYVGTAGRSTPATSSGQPSL